jgi:hypothetical protein
MKKKSTSHSAFLNLRVLFGLFVILARVFLALVTFGTLSSVFAQTNKTNPIQQAVQPANDAPGTDLSSADPNLNPQLAPQPRVVYGNPEGDPRGSLQGRPAPTSAWGSQQGATWIAASQFTVRLSSTSPVLTYAGNFFFNSPGSAAPVRYYAQLQVEPGVLISHLTCVYNDSSAVNNITFVWWNYMTDISTGTTTVSSLDSFTTSGTPGVGFNFLTPPSPVTMSTYDGSSLLTNHHISADIASDTSFAGCWAFWNRQVAPGPATATFSDVPTSSPWFQYVEALVDTNVTGGCAPGLYCPNDPITRGQMSVFLARALGMGFQY